MNKNKSNTDKILKLIGKFDTDDLPELNNILKDYMTQRIMAKALEYSELAEKLQSISEKINGK